MAHPNTRVTLRMEAASNLVDSQPQLPLAREYNQATCGSPFRVELENSMKLRAIALSGSSAGALLLTLVFLCRGQATTRTGPASSTPTPPPPLPAEPSATKVAHDGSIDDLDAIGNRNVGCAKGMGNWYGLEKQIAMGKQISMQVESQSKIINDPVVSEYINRLGQNLVRNSDSQVPFTIKVIDSDDINAFALPGGFFYVNSGLILAADEEAELAGVMAHEIGHVAACHAARENTRGNLMQMMTIPLIFIGGPIGYAAYEGAGLAVPLDLPQVLARIRSPGRLSRN